MRRSRAAAALLMIMLLTGCAGTAGGPGRDSNPVPPAPPAAEAEPNGQELPEPTVSPEPVEDSSGPEGLHGPGIRSGIPAVDAAIEAAVTQDVEALGGLLAMSEVPCTTQVHGMTGLPVCPEGVSDGTPVEVFPLASCNLSYADSLERAQRAVERTFSRPLFVYAVYRLDGQDEVSSKYAVSLAEGLDDEKAPLLFLDDSGAIVKVHTGCGRPGTAVSDEGAEFVIAPKR